MYVLSLISLIISSKSWSTSDSNYFLRAASIISTAASATTTSFTSHRSLFNFPEYAKNAPERAPPAASKTKWETSSFPPSISVITI